MQDDYLIYDCEWRFLYDLTIFCASYEQQNADKKNRRDGSQKGKRPEAAYKGKEGAEKEINEKRWNECDFVSARFILNRHRDAPANRSIEMHVYLYSGKCQTIIFLSYDSRNDALSLSILYNHVRYLRKYKASKLIENTFFVT